MQKMSWTSVARNLDELVDNPPPPSLKKEQSLKKGQEATLRAIAKRLPNNGVILADDVGMGKTRVAACLALAVQKAGGRVAILVPPGLGYQWNEELRQVGVDAPPLLRTFSQYLEVWSDPENLPWWFDQSILVISHLFTNWRLGADSVSWRWNLLPEVYARWRKMKSNRWPRGYYDYLDEGERVHQEWVQDAAQRIVNDNGGRLDKIFSDKIEWNNELFNGANYAKDQKFRPLLEQVIGLGLGLFDLIIIDEAHKARAEETSLSTLLERVVQPARDVRRLAMTATPIELHNEQWEQMLQRIGVDKEKIPEITTSISNYQDAVDEVRLRSNEKDCREKFKTASDGCKKALSPYLLRRDKREEESIKDFQELTREEYYAYRSLERVEIDPSRETQVWKEVICAAEAMSFCARGHRDDENAAQKRKDKAVRFTVANGHSLAKMMDCVLEEEEKNIKPVQEQNKRETRLNWWREVLRRNFADKDDALFSHPTILAAVNKIEEISKAGEKVLVFGHFNLPLRALHKLLNAREMLRSLDEGRPWPQRTVRTEEVAAVAAAWNQLYKGKNFSLTRLNEELKKQYNKFENQRKRSDEKLMGKLKEGLSEKEQDSKYLLRVFNEFQSDKKRKYLLSAMQQLVGLDLTELKPADCVEAFKEIVGAARDPEKDTDMRDREEDEDEDESIPDLGSILQRLDEDYGVDKDYGGRATYARFMWGETKMPARRFLQAVFNSERSSLKVLVAQSKVAQEGLNLHRACRNVLILHPEWNPGILEQQIGRIDRIGSLWEQKLKDYKDKQGKEEGKKENPPRLRVHTVIFKHTYDEYNWNVLERRRADLQAQLNGIIITSEEVPREIREEINSLAPNFSPSNKE